MFSAENGDKAVFLACVFAAGFLVAMQIFGG